MRWFRWIVIVIVIIITVVRVCAVRHLRSRTKIFPIVEKHLLRRVSSSRTRARNSVKRRIILQRRSIFPVPVPTRGWESKSCHYYSLRTIIESNRRRRGCACAGACAHTARSNADLSSATGKKYTAPHTQRQRETRTHALGASRATTRRERCVSRAIMSDESFVFDFKVSFRTSGYILSFQIFPSLLRVAASSYFLTPSPDATPDAHAT